MRNLLSSNTCKWLSFLMISLFLFSQNIVCGPAFAAAEKAKTKVKHKPIKYFVAEKRISIDVDVKDPKGVEIVRCYFRSQGEADFVFVSMQGNDMGTYNAILPAPSKTTEVIEYVFLVVNSEKQIAKTQTFTIPKSDSDNKSPAWQQTGSEGEIAVKTELPQAPAELPGFTDSITLDTVESSLRFGVVAGGLYAATSSTTTGTTVAASTTTVAASSGVSTALVVGMGAAALVTGVGVAADDDNDDNGDQGGDNGDEGGDNGDEGGDTGGTGDVKVTLQWSDCNDLDLYVTDPCQNRIYYQNPSAMCQGHTGQLDLDANVQTCSPSPVENIFWTTAPSGTYSVSIMNLGQTTSSYTVTVKNGDTTNTYTGSVSGGVSVSITSFTH